MELLRQIWGGFRRWKREKDSASIDACINFDIQILEVLVLQRGSATVIPKHASVRGSYDAKSTENLVDRQWLAEAIGLPISHDVKTEAVISWKFKGLDCTYKSRHRVPEADTRIVGSVVLWFYHNRPPDISTSDLSQFQLGLQKCLDIRDIEPENFKKKRTISWRRKSFRYPSKHSNQGTSAEPTQAIVSGSNHPEPLSRRSIGDDWKLVGPISLPGVTEAEQEHSGTFVGPSDDSVVGRPLRSEGPPELVSGTGLTCPGLIQPPEIVDSPPGQDSPESSTASTQPTVLVRPPSHSREDKEVQNDTKVPISPYPKDTRLRPGGTVAFPSQNALHGDMAKDSSQHSTETTYGSSPTLYTRRTIQEAPTATDGTSVKHSTVGGTRPTPAAAGPSIPPFPKTSHSEPLCPDVGGSRLPTDETMSASSSDSSSRKFPDEYWIWDEAAKNYFHSYEEDGTIKQKWLPKEDEFL